MGIALAITPFVMLTFLLPWMRRVRPGQSGPSATVGTAVKPPSAPAAEPV